MPEPVDVDLAHLVKASALVNPELFRGSSKAPVAPLPSAGLIASAIATQQSLKSQNTLISTNAVILGAGKQPTVVTEAQLAMLDRHTPVANVVKTTDVRQLGAAADPRSSVTNLVKTTEARHVENIVSDSSSPVLDGESDLDKKQKKPKKPKKEKTSKDK